MYDSGKIRFEYPSDYEVITNNTEDVQAIYGIADLFGAGAKLNNSDDPDHETVEVDRYDNMRLDKVIDLSTGAAMLENMSLEESMVTPLLLI